MKDIISIVILTYNQQATIGRAIESVLMQKCHVPYEIIIGEDCSTDNTRAICKTYADQHPNIIRLFCNERNKGIVDNYFDCLLQCRGKYIADCAGDDFWTDPQKLEKEVSVMEEHPEVTMVITNWQYYNEQTRKASPSQQIQHAPITPGRNLLKAIITQKNMSVFHLCTALYRADVFREAYEKDRQMFRDTDYVSEDMQVAFAMASHGNIAYLPDITLNYSFGSHSVSNTTNDVKLFTFVRNTTRQICYMADKEQLDIQPFLSQRLFELGMHAFRAHRRPFYEETLICEKAWNAPRTAKTNVLFTVMRYEWLWKLGVTVRRLVVSLKRARH